MSEDNWVTVELDEFIKDEQFTPDGIKHVANMATSFAQSLVDILVDTDGSPIDWDTRADKIYTLYLDATVLNGVINSHPSVDHKDALGVADEILREVRHTASVEHSNSMHAITKRLQEEHGLKPLPFS